MTALRTAQLEKGTLYRRFFVYESVHNSNKVPFLIAFLFTHQYTTDQQVPRPPGAATYQSVDDDLYS